MRALIAILALILPATSFAGPLRWGFEAGGNYSTLDLRSTPMPNHETDGRVLPALSVFAERRVSARWSVTPGLRYAQQGGKSSWQDELAGGTEESLEHTMSGGIGVRCRVAGPAFISVNPEVTYLVSGKLSRREWNFDDTWTHEDSYDSDTDRWNGTLRAGIGSTWAVAGGTGSVNLRYVRGVSDMTRVVPNAAPWARNIPWTADATVRLASEWRAQGVELVAGFQW